MVRHVKQLLTILCLIFLSSYSYSENPPPDGPYETFHENGQLEGKENFKDGQLDGPFEGFHDNGQLEFRENYKDGEPDGPWEEFDEEGNLTKSGKMGTKVIHHKK